MELSANNEIRNGGKNLRVVGIVDDLVAINNGGFINGVQIIVYDAVYTIYHRNIMPKAILPWLRVQAKNNLRTDLMNGVVETWADIGYTIDN